MIMERTYVKNSLRLDMYGYFNLLPNFKFKLRVHTYPYNLDGTINAGAAAVLLTTDAITAATATAETVKTALVNTGAVAPSDVSIGGGNLIERNDLINNQALRWLLQSQNVTPATPQDQLKSYIGTWFIKFGSRFDGFSIAVEPLTESGGPFSQTQLQALISLRSTLIPSGVVTTVNDVFMVPVSGPLVGGTVVACVDFPGIGYGIISAGSREFFSG